MKREKLEDNVHIKVSARIKLKLQKIAEARNMTVSILLRKMIYKGLGEK